MYLVRKVARAKWEPRAPLAEAEIGADAVTADLRTADNALSFWTCAAVDLGELDEVVLAIAAASDRPDKLDLVWIDQESVERDGVALRASEGRTPVHGLRHRHVDAVGLDLTRLGTLARHVAEAIRGKGQWRRLSKNEVMKALKKAVKSNRLALPDLAAALGREVQRGLAQE